MATTGIARSNAVLLAVVLCVSLVGSAHTTLAGDRWFLGDAVAHSDEAWPDVDLDRGHGDDDDDDAKCKKVGGHATWTLIPSPNDPFGRILGPSTGDLKAAISAYITNLTPGDNGVLSATSVEVWVLGAQDILVFDGEATFTPIPDQPIGTVYDALTLTVVGGSGAYDGATGTLQVTGVGHNIYGPDSGPGKGFFEIRYKGEICRPR